MKKSKLIAITILAASILSCNKKKSKHPPLTSWDDAGSAYVSTDGGNMYQQTNGGFPMWLYWYAIYRPGYGYYYNPGAVYYYHSGSRYSRMGYSESGSAHSISGKSARGGFGSLGRSVSA